jgi:hypothetical protein
MAINRVYGQSPAGLSRTFTLLRHELTSSKNYRLCNSVSANLLYGFDQFICNVCKFTSFCNQLQCKLNSRSRVVGLSLPFDPTHEFHLQSVIPYQYFLNTFHPLD